MKLYLKILVLSLVVGLWPVAAQAFDFQVRPTSAQDGWVIGDPGSAGNTSGYGVFGSSGGKLWTMVGIHTIPGSINAGTEILSAELRIPQVDSLWSGSGAGDTETWSATLIDPISDTMVSGGDRDSASLGSLGTYRAAGAIDPDRQRYMAYNVTTELKTAVDAAGRDAFAWRLDVDSIPVPDASLYFPTVDNTDGAFGTLDGHAGNDNHGARLLITLVPEPVSAGLMLLGGMVFLRRSRRTA